MDKIISLDKLKIGQKAVVTVISTADKKIRRRLMDMGITNGVVVEVIKFAPLGDPVAIKLRNYILTIRKQDLKQIQGKLINKKFENCMEI